MPYWDLNVTYTEKTDMKELIQEAASLGYDGLAFTHNTDKLSDKDVCSITKPIVVSSNDGLTDDADPSVIVCSGLSNSQFLRPSESYLSKKSFHVLTRINITMSDHAQKHNFNSTNSVLASYDLVSITPSDEKIMQNCISGGSVDIVSFDFSKRLPFHLKLTPVKMAIERNVYFEVCYSASLKDSSARKNLISNCLHLFFLSRGRNIIFSSGAKKAIEIKAPQDVINLAILFGLQSDISSTILNSNVYSVLKHAETRKTLRGTGTIALRKSRDEDLLDSQRNKKQKN